MSVLRKIKRIVTGERVDLQTGETVDHELRLRERVSSIPMAPPIDYKREPTIFELLKQKMLQHKVEELQAALGAESPEEAEDFDVPDPDVDSPSSPYEYERHEEELQENMAKLAAFQQFMEAKYPDRYKRQKTAPEAENKEGGEGGIPPSKGASSAAPKAPKEPAGPKGRSEVPEDEDD